MAISASVGSGGGAGSLERDREATLRVYTNLFVYQRNNSYDRASRAGGGAAAGQRRLRGANPRRDRRADGGGGNGGCAVPTNNAMYRILNSCDAPRDSPTVGLAG